MAKSFDELVNRSTTKQTRAKAAKRTRELLGELEILDRFPNRRVRIDLDKKNQD
jgi:hypothetical protein